MFSCVRKSSGKIVVEYFRMWPWDEKVLEILTVFFVLALGVMMMIQLKRLSLGTTCPILQIWK